MHIWIEDNVTFGDLDDVGKIIKVLESSKDYYAEVSETLKKFDKNWNESCEEYNEIFGSDVPAIIE